MDSVAPILVDTESGPILGAKKVSILGDDYYSFQRIPYAEPPVGELRFRVSDAQSCVACNSYPHN